jgi:hypothetical protein
MMKAKESYYTPGVAISGLENCIKERTAYLILAGKRKNMRLNSPSTGVR